MTFDPSSLHGRSVALLLIEQSEDGDWRVFECTADWDGERLALRRRSDDREFNIAPEWFERIAPVDDSTRDALPNTEFMLPLIVGELPEGADESAMRRTGWNWDD